MKPEALRDFPVIVEAPVAWGEMDAFGHVNNIVYFRYFESARIAYFEALGYLELMRDKGVGPILAETHCRFRLPLAYPDQLAIGARAGEILADGFMMHYAVFSQFHQRLAAEGTGRIVSYDYGKKCKTPLPDTLRTRLETLESRS